MKLLKGKPLADEILNEVKANVETFPSTPILRVYSDDKNQPYYKGILKDATYCGIRVVNHDDPMSLIDCDGAISLIKDVQVRAGLDMDGGGTVPCTAEATMRLLEYYDIPVTGKDVCIIGRSERVGKPLARLMTDADATVTLCHSKTPDLARVSHMHNSHIIVSCVGGANFSSCVPDCLGTLIDIGGDFIDVQEGDYANYAPVVGGVGPVTRAVLMEHVVERYVRNRNLYG